MLCDNPLNASLPPPIVTSFSRHIRGFVNLVAESHLLLDLCNGLARVKTLGAGSCAVKDSVATVQAHRVLEVGLSLGGALVTRVGEPSVRLEKDGGAKVLLRVPPVRWA